MQHLHVQAYEMQMRAVVVAVELDLEAGPRWAAVVVTPRGCRSNQWDPLKELRW